MAVVIVITAKEEVRSRRLRSDGWVQQAQDFYPLRLLFMSGVKPEVNSPPRIPLVTRQQQDS